MSKAGALIWRKLFETGDARRLAKQVQDLSDLAITRDIPYIDDGERGHLFDIYRLPDAPAGAPVVVNIHGGGLFASYKEVNANFNYEWARMGYTVASISYRRIPETTLWHQVDDVMAAFLEGSGELREAFGIAASGLSFRAAASASLSTCSRWDILVILKAAMC